MKWEYLLLFFVLCAGFSPNNIYFFVLESCCLNSNIMTTPSTPTGGRKRDEIWKHFTEVSDVGLMKTNRVKCRICAKEVVGLVARMKAHYNLCKKSDMDENDDAAYALSDNNSDTGELSASPSQHQLKRNIPLQEESVNKIPKIDYFCVKTTPAQKKKIDLQLAKFFYATNTPFLHVEHPEFEKLMQELRPGYRPPNRQQLSSDMLDEVHSSLKTKLHHDLKNKNVTMSLDGWSNIRNDSIICIAITDVLSGSVYLIDTVDTGDNSHTAEYLLTLAIQSIKKCEEFGCIVRSFVTDNASNMTKMRQELAQSEILTNHGDIVTYGCSSHLLNLLSHDLDEPAVTNSIKNIVKYFRNSHFTSAKYKQNGGKALSLPITVRWNSMANCLEDYLENWHIMSKICLEFRAAIDSNIISLVENMTLKVNAQYLLKKLKNISVSLDIAQRECCTIGEVTQTWLELEKKFENDDLENEYSLRDLQRFKARFEKAVTHAHYVANLIDARYRGKDLNEDRLDTALNFINTFYPAAMPDIIKYRANSFPFNEYLFTKYALEVHPLTWWQSLEGNVSSDMINLARQLHSAVASSAGVERLFSTFGFVQSKLRNRLSNDKTAKLVTVFKSLNNKNTLSNGGQYHLDYLKETFVD